MTPAEIYAINLIFNPSLREKFFLSSQQYHWKVELPENREEAIAVCQALQKISDAILKFASTLEKPQWGKPLAGREALIFAVEGSSPNGAGWHPLDAADDRLLNHDFLGEMSFTTYSMSMTLHKTLYENYVKPHENKPLLETETLQAFCDRVLVTSNSSSVLGYSSVTAPRIYPNRNTLYSSTAEQIELFTALEAQLLAKRLEAGIVRVINRNP